MASPQPGAASSGGPKGQSPDPPRREPPLVKGPVLPWMRVPLRIQAGSGVPVDQVPGLDARLVSKLHNGFGFPELFPVQAAVWHHAAGGLSAANDLCVAAPTGSGKTLAYALPLANALAAPQFRGFPCSMGSADAAWCSALTSSGGPRQLPASGAGGRRVRALVVLPTRDLAAQVYEMFRPLCDAVQLRVALAAARASEAAEAAQLVGDAAAGADAGGGGGGRLDAGGALGSGGGGVGADVVVATPGRLIAHLNGTPGFTLHHLRFLVVDETDRLLRQSYQEWLPRVLALIEPGRARSQQRQPHFHRPPHHSPHHHQLQQKPVAGGGFGGWAEWSGTAPYDHFASRWPSGSTGAVLPFSQPRVVKIIVSATLTRDPAKLQRLDLHNPRFVATMADGGGGGASAGAGYAEGGATAAAAAARYSLPRSLSEYRLLCSAPRKPLALLALLRDSAGQSSIVFTSSLDMTHKLYLMLRAVSDLPDEVVEYSSHVPQRERAAALERFRSGAAKVLVASDAMTRGMDVEGVANVINYDAPVYAKTYVHRAGRTARAGKPGRVVTLLRDEDMRHFKSMIRKADNNYVRELRMPSERLEELRPALAGALRQLEELLAAERTADRQVQHELQRQGQGQKRSEQGQQGQKEELGRQPGKQKGEQKEQQEELRQQQPMAAAEMAVNPGAAAAAAADGGAKPKRPRGHASDSVPTATGKRRKEK